MPEASYVDESGKTGIGIKIGHFHIVDETRKG